jgi:hypothetical protein
VPNHRGTLTGSWEIEDTHHGRERDTIGSQLPLASSAIGYGFHLKNSSGDLDTAFIKSSSLAKAYEVSTTSEVADIAPPRKPWFQTKPPAVVAYMSNLEAELNLNSSWARTVHRRFQGTSAAAGSRVMICSWG